MPVTMFLLTEDAGRNGAEVMPLLVKKLCARVDPQCQTQKLKLVPGKEHASGVSGSYWKSNQKETIDMLKDVATRLVRGEFVLLHFDGDVPWARHEESGNVRFFQGEFTDKVRRLLESRKKDASVVDQLVAVVPFHEMEAWLYQATDEAKAKCTCRGDKAKDHAALFDCWKADRTLLDEIVDTKDACCLKDDHNADLAKAFPAADVEAVGKSFAATVQALKASPKFVAALASTYAPPAASSAVP
jgi:hypothetical protein